MQQKPEVVWVLGASGAGKATFIRTIISRPPDSLLRQFGWIDKRITACEESLDLLTQFDGDPIAAKREVLLRAVPKLVQQADVVLIKGQDWDIDADRLRRLKDVLPQARHRIIFVRCTFPTLYRRLRHKRWWRPLITRRLARQWLVWQATALHRLEREFGIQAIDGGSHGHYHLVAFTKAGLPSPRHLLKRRHGFIPRRNRQNLVQ